MGTKNKPGQFDCYAAADDDEPMFVMLARDPLAPILTEIWAAMKSGQVIRARDILRAAAAQKFFEWTIRDPADTKVLEAQECARAMRVWREADIEKDRG